MAVVDRVRELVAPLVAAEDAELYDVEHNGGVVRVLVDRAGGVDLDTLARLTRLIGRTLDDHDPVPGRYTLEVSSPGLERPLRTVEHFRSALDTEIRVKTRPHVEGDRRVRGVLVAVDDDGIEVRTDDGGVRRIAHDDIARARTVFEWGPPPRPSGRRSRSTDRPSKREASTP